MYHIEKKCIPDELKNTKVCLYGGGHTGHIIIDLFQKEGVKIDNIIDDNENIQGLEIKGIRIISYQHFKENYKDEKVSLVLACIYTNIILKKIDNMPNVKVYELFDWYDDIVRATSHVQRAEGEALDNLKCKWDSLRDKWEDDESRKVLDGLYTYFQTKERKYIEEICSNEEQYLIREVLDSIKEPLYVIDGGAYKGELVQAFTDKNIEVKKYYFFEPDVENFTELRALKINDMDEYINKGLWNEEGTFFFEAGKGAISRIVQYTTEDAIEVTTIDNVVGREKCNFIKMDIEGAEYNALLGARNTIERERPILAISVYHSTEDYWKIPTYLMENLENYRFYLRHHAVILSETVLYAIPKERY